MHALRIDHHGLKCLCVRSRTAREALMQDDEPWHCVPRPSTLVLDPLRSESQRGREPTQLGEHVPVPSSQHLEEHNPLYYNANVLQDPLLSRRQVAQRKR